jgi:hypothetical protein
MYYVWAATIIGCITLSGVLVARNHYIRYGWLLSSAILSVILDVYMYSVKQFHHAMYRHSREFIFFLFLGLSGMVMFEAWRWGNKWVQIPQEIQVFLGLVLVMMRHSIGNCWTVYYFDCTLRVTNLLMIVGFLILFSRTPSQLREVTHDRPRAPQPPPEEAEGT